MFGLVPVLIKSDVMLIIVLALFRFLTGLLGAVADSGCMSGYQLWTSFSIQFMQASYRDAMKYDQSLIINPTRKIQRTFRAAPLTYLSK